MSDFSKLTAKAKRLVREKEYEIDPHATDDYSEREIFVDDVLETLKTGSIISEESAEKGTSFYVGETRYRWIGQDIKDRVLRLIVLFKKFKRMHKEKEKLIVVSACEANTSEAKAYLKENADE